MKLDANAFSLKRLAWAYGCAKKGSDEETELLKELVQKARGHTSPEQQAVPAERMSRLRSVPR